MQTRFPGRALVNVQKLTLQTQFIGIAQASAQRATTLRNLPVHVFNIVPITSTRTKRRENVWLLASKNIIHSSIQRLGIVWRRAQISTLQMRFRDHVYSFVHFLFSETLSHIIVWPLVQICQLFTIRTIIVGCA